MRVTCLKEHLTKGLSIVSRAVSTRSTLPVLANVLLATDNGRLKLSATNLETVITCWVGAKVEQEGAITVPSRTMSDLVGTLAQEQVQLSMPDQQIHTLHVNCARTEANIRGIDAQEFPLIPDPNLSQGIRLRAMSFKQMITQVALSAATDDTRPILTGVSIHIEGSQIKLAATDAFRLSVRTAELPTHVDEPKSVVVPARALTEVARVITNDDEMLYLIIPEGRNQIIFKLDDIVIVSQLIEGTFPDFSSIIPKRYTTRAVLNTAAMLKACKTAAIFARESNHTARIKLEPTSELMPAFAAITATSTQTGDNHVQIDANVEGNSVEVAFNVKFLTDVLSVIDTPEIAMETTSSMDPGVFKPVGEDGFLHIIMPMHFGR